MNMPLFLRKKNKVINTTNSESTQYKSTKSFKEDDQSERCFTEVYDDSFIDQECQEFADQIILFEEQSYYSYKFKNDNKKQKYLLESELKYQSTVSSSEDFSDDMDVIMTKYIS